MQLPADGGSIRMQHLELSERMGIHTVESCREYIQLTVLVSLPLVECYWCKPISAMQPGEAHIQARVRTTKNTNKSDIVPFPNQSLADW